METLLITTNTNGVYLWVLDNPLILLNRSAPTILEIKEILRIYIFQSLSSVDAAMYHKDAG